MTEECASCNGSGGAPGATIRACPECGGRGTVTFGQGGFAVVSAGISQALIATAVGLFVALEAVVLFNVLQNAGARLARDLGILADEMLELILSDRRDHAGSTVG